MFDFSARAKDWDADPQKVHRAAEIGQAIRRQIPLQPDWKALEYGCGTGLLSFALQPYLGQITLADSAPGMIAVLSEKIARHQTGNMSPVLLDLEKSVDFSGEYDCIYTLMTMHHILDVPAVLKEFCRLLRPGGWVGIADLDREDGTFHPAGFEGHLGFERVELSSWLSAAGFGNFSYSIPYTMRRGEGGQQRSYPLFLLTAQKTADAKFL